MIRGAVKIDVAGLRQVDKESKRRSITLKAVKAGIKIVNRAAKDEAPRRSGALRKVQGWISKKGRKGQTGSFAVQGARRNLAKTGRVKGKPISVIPANYEHFIRLGTKPHGGHPGSKPNDFRRRAWNRTKDAAADAVKNTLAIEIQKTIAAASKVK